MIFTSPEELIATLKEELRQVVKEELALANEKKKEKLYSVEETCEILKISVGTLLNYRNSGKIKSIKIGHKPLFSQEEIDRVKLAFKK